MKIYFNLCLEGFSNCYAVVNDDPAVKEAFIVDPGKITPQLISHIEENNYNLTAVLITHNHTSHVKGLSTLQKIYSPYIYAADSDIGGTQSIVLRGNGEIKVAGLDVQYFSVPGHSADSMIFKVGNVIFTGDTVTSGIVGETPSKYSKQLLVNNIFEKIFSQTDTTVLMPGHGPPSTVESERQFNLDLSYKSN